MIVYDNITITASNRKTDKNGFLKVKACNLTKEQVAPYYGDEIPNWKDFDLEAKKIYYVYRPETEIAKAVDTFNNLPLTRDHIEVDVNNVPKDRIVGSLGDHAEYKAPYLKNSLIVYDQTDIDNILDGKKKELSCGYRYTPVRKSGEWHGQHYDFVMTDIIGNHVALVREGRAGHDVVVADEMPNFTNSDKSDNLNLMEKEKMIEDEFKESEHPRDKSGRFTDKGGESGGVPEDYKKSVAHYSKEQHERAANFYGEKMATAQRKANKEDDPNVETYRAQFEEYKNLTHYHEDMAKGGSGSKEESSKETDVKSLYNKERENYLNSEDYELFKKANQGSARSAAGLQYRNTKMTDWSKYDIEETLKDVEHTTGGKLEDFDKNHIKDLAREKVQYEWLQKEAKKETTNDKAIPDEQDKPETAGDVKAEKEDKTTMDEVKTKALADDKCAKDEESKEEKTFAEGVDYGEEKEKKEPKKLDSEHESEGAKKADEKKKDEKEAEDKCTKDSALTMDIDTIKAQVRAEMVEDFKAREEARKSVEPIIGDVNVMAFDSCNDIYKLACEKEGLPVNEIVSYKDALTGYMAGKAKLAEDASPVSGSNEECFKDIRV